MKSEFILKRTNLKRRSRKLYIKNYNKTNGTTLFVENPIEATIIPDVFSSISLSESLTFRGDLGFSVRLVRMDHEFCKYLREKTEKENKKE